MRASYGTSFRAPLISQIYGNSNNLFVQSYQNPAGGAAITGVALSGAEPGPRAGRRRPPGPRASTGSITDDVQLSLTYFDVEYEGQVDSYLSQPRHPGARGGLRRHRHHPARHGGRRPACSSCITQGVAVVAARCRVAAPANVTVFVDGRSQNLGVSRTKGLDFAGQLSRCDTDRLRHLQLLAERHLPSQTSNVAITSTAPPVDRLNTIFNPLKLKLRGARELEPGRWRALGRGQPHATATRTMR